MKPKSATPVDEVEVIQEQEPEKWMIPVILETWELEIDIPYRCFKLKLPRGLPNVIGVLAAMAASLGIVVAACQWWEYSLCLILLAACLLCPARKERRPARDNDEFCGY